MDHRDITDGLQFALYAPAFLASLAILHGWCWL